MNPGGRIGLLIGVPRVEQTDNLKSNQGKGLTDDYFWLALEPNWTRGWSMTPRLALCIETQCFIDLLAVSVTAIQLPIFRHVLAFIYGGN